MDNKEKFVMEMVTNPAVQYRIFSKFLKINGYRLEEDDQYYDSNDNHIKVSKIKKQFHNEYIKNL